MSHDKTGIKKQRFRFLIHSNLFVNTYISFRTSMTKKSIFTVLLTITVLSVDLKAQHLAGYLHNWNDQNAPFLQIQDVDPRYTIIYCAFALPASGTDYNMEFSPESQSIEDFREQIEILQLAGKKVLISIGGATAPVQLNSVLEKEQFVTSMLNLLDTYGFDGIDIDLEGSSLSVSGGTISSPVDIPVILLIEAFREIMQEYHTAAGKKMMLSAAPETAFVQGGQSAYGSIWGAYLPVLDALRDSMDLLHVQLYNSGTMYGIDGGIYAQGTVDFIVSQTEAVIAGFNTQGGFFQGFPQQKVAVGLPACSLAAGGGYVNPDSVEAALNYLIGSGPQTGSYALQHAASYPALGGMMTWSINWDAVASCSGEYSYADVWQQVFDITTTNFINQGEQVVIYPNPCGDFLYIQDTQTAAAYTIQDLTGTVVQSGILHKNEVQTDQLPAGIYILHLNGKFKRFAKQ